VRGAATPRQSAGALAPSIAQAHKPEDAPPMANRGVRLTTKTVQRIHNIEGVTWGRSSETVKADVLAFVGWGEFVDVEGAKGGYTWRSHGPLGITVKWGNRDDIHVSVSGSACDELGYENTLALASLLELRASRIDWAWDECPFTVGQVEDAFRSGQVNTKVRRDSWHKHESVRGQTFYMGSAYGERRLMAYDMRGFTRLELRMRGDKAQEALEGLYAAGTEVEMSRYMMGLVTGFCDFVKRSAGSGNVSRSPRLRWWASLVGFTDRIRMAAAEVVHTTEKAIKTGVRYAATFYTWVEVVRRKSGMSLAHALSHAYNSGRRMAKPRHEVVISRQRPLGDMTPF
jgi:hypothetical protein